MATDGRRPAIDQVSTRVINQLIVET